MCSKDVIVLITGLLCLAAANAGSIEVQHYYGDHPISFEVEYKYDGKSYTKLSGDFSNGAQKKIEIPPEATDIHLKVNESGQVQDLFFNKSPDAFVIKCFNSSGAYRYAEEKYCERISMTVNQVGNFKVVAEVTYSGGGPFPPGFSFIYYEEISKGQNKTVGGPGYVTNFRFTLSYQPEAALFKRTIATKAYPFPVKKCFEVYGDEFSMQGWFEKPCQKLPAANGNSISVSQNADEKVIFHITYDYDDSQLTESSGSFSKGEKRTMQIPDKATNIKVTMYVDDVMKKMPIIFERYYSSPVKTCLIGDEKSVDKWSEIVC